MLAVKASDFPWRTKAECGRAERAHTPCNRNRRKFLLRFGKNLKDVSRSKSRSRKRKMFADKRLGGSALELSTSGLEIFVAAELAEGEEF